MGLGVDGAGQDQAVAEILCVAGRGRGAIAYCRDLAVANGDIAALDDAVGKDDGAGEGEVEV
jgi:hypothetical protein